MSIVYHSQGATQTWLTGNNRILAERSSIDPSPSQPTVQVYETDWHHVLHTMCLYEPLNRVTELSLSRGGNNDGQLSIMSGVWSLASA